MTKKKSHKHKHTHLSEMDARVNALQSLLEQKGYVDSDAIDEIVEVYENKIGPRNGAKVVARAWTEPNFKKMLLEDATKAVHDMGFTSRQGEHVVAVENTPSTHHLVVCTLCSCYPWSLLGLPPKWYKSPQYRSRAVIDPRGVLEEFGVKIAESRKIVVHDSTAETRYIVIPEQPKGTKKWSTEQLEKIVTRDSMIGTGIPKKPNGTKSRRGKS